MKRIRKICFIEVTGVTGGKGHGMLYMEVKTHQHSYLTVQPMIYYNTCQMLYVHLHHSNTITKVTNYSMIGTCGPLQRDNYILGTVNSEKKKKRKKHGWDVLGPKGKPVSVVQQDCHGNKLPSKYLCL